MNDIFPELKRNEAFTLLELSIVLVIIGLVIGGVIAGRDLIKAAQMNSSISALKEINVATNVFRLKYNALPGDFDKAVDYQIHLNPQGVNTSCGFVNSTRFYGNNDGMLSGYTIDSKPVYSGEMTNFFVYLTNSEIWGTTIIGNSAASANCRGATSHPLNYQMAGVHYPKLDFGDGTIVISNTTDRKHYFVYGGMGEAHNSYLSHDGSGNSRFFNDDILPADAYAIDDKYDDGNPLSGIIKVSDFAAGYRNDTADDSGAGIITFDQSDSATNCVYNAAYNLSYDTESCTLLIELGRF